MSKTKWTSYNVFFSSAKSSRNLLNDWSLSRLAQESCLYFTKLFGKAPWHLLKYTQKKCMTAHLVTVCHELKHIMPPFMALALKSERGFVTDFKKVES